MPLWKNPQNAAPKGHTAGGLGKWSFRFANTSETPLLKVVTRRVTFHLAEIPNFQKENLVKVVSRRATFHLVEMPNFQKENLVKVVTRRVTYFLDEIPDFRSKIRGVGFPLPFSPTGRGRGQPPESRKGFLKKVVVQRTTRCLIEIQMFRGKIWGKSLKPQKLLMEKELYKRTAQYLSWNFCLYPHKSPLHEKRTVSVWTVLFSCLFCLFTTNRNSMSAASNVNAAALSYNITRRAAHYDA